MACGAGTDCADCGPRLDVSRHLCTSCPLECNALGKQAQSLWCLEDMVNNGVCDPQCNNRACEHDRIDCTLDDARAACVPLMPPQLTQPPAPMPVMHSAASVAAALAGVVGAFGVPPPPIRPGQQPFMPPPFPPGVFAPPPPHGAPRPW